MTDADLTTFTNRCNTEMECKFLQTPISASPALQCYSGDICITCEQMDTLYRSYISRYPSDTPTILEPDSTQRKINEHFANFMNNRLGFGKQAWEYLQFMNNCQNAGLYGDCARWDSLITDFKYQYTHNVTPTPRANDTNGCDSSMWKYPHLEERWVPLRDLLDSGVFRPNPAHDDFQDCIHFYDSTCVDTTITFECRIKQPKAGPTFTGYGSAYAYYMSFQLDNDNPQFNFVYNPGDSNATLIVSGLGYPGAGNITFPLSNNYEDFRNFKIVFTADKYKLYFDGAICWRSPPYTNTQV